MSQTAKTNIDNAAANLDGTKTNVKSKLTEATGDVKAKLTEATGDVKSKLTEATGDAKENLSDLSGAAQQKLAKSGRATKSAALNARELLERNPLGLALGSVAAGFLIGLALPVSDIERDNVGAFGEKVKDQAKQAATEMVAQGKSAVATAVTDALSSNRN